MRIIIDIDGVVADFSRRAKLLPDWHRFFEDIDNDPPIPSGVELARALIAWFGPSQVVWITGRYEPLREATLRWLVKNVYFGTDSTQRRFRVPIRVLMRPSGDERPSCVIKPIIAAPLNPDLVIDDEPSVIEAFLEVGVTGMVFSANRELSRYTRRIEDVAEDGSLRAYSKEVHNATR